MKKLVLLSSLIFLCKEGDCQAKRQIIDAEVGSVQYGIASFYHDKFEGRPTSSGEIFSQSKMTAAHNTLPLNTWIRVTNLRNQKSIIVRVNDRLHHRNTRLVDLSSKAAGILGYKGRGIVKVKVEVLGKKKPVITEEKNKDKLDK